MIAGAGGAETAGWEAALSGIPDSGFFEVMRHYLGPVSTPFHRPDLIERLAGFMGRPEAAEAAAAYLDAEDALLLSCIFIHDSPDEAELLRILPEGPGRSPLALRERLFNLEERLLIRRTRGGVNAALRAGGQAGGQAGDGTAPTGGAARASGAAGASGPSVAARADGASGEARTSRESGVFGKAGADGEAGASGEAQGAGETGAAVEGGAIEAEGAAENWAAGGTAGPGGPSKAGGPGRAGRRAGASILVLTPLGRRLLRMGCIGPGAVIGAPVLSPVHSPVNASASASVNQLEPGTAADSARSENPPRLNDSVLNAVLAFLSESAPLLLKNGSIRKKSMELIEQRFPAFFRDGSGPSRVFLMGKMLIAAGLARRNGVYLQPVLENWRSLEALSPRERRSFLLARAAAGTGLPAASAVEIVRTLLECLPEGQACNVENLLILLRLLAGRSCPLSERAARRIITNLVLLGELSAAADGSAARPPAAGEHSRDKTQASPPVPVLTLTPAGDIRCRPEFPFICDFALAAEPVSTDTVSTFRFSKDRFLGALETGIAADTFFTILETHSQRPIPQNLKILASEWENDYRSLRLGIGVFLEITDSRRELVSETGVLDPYTLSRPAPGLWILKPDEEHSWRAELARIGIDRLPPLPSPPPITPGQSAKNPSRIPRPHIPQREPRLAPVNWNHRPFDNPEKRLAALAAHPAVDTLSEGERREFTERLKRRTILIPRQIRPGAWRDETAEAKGFDYPGKLRLIEAALSSRNQYLKITAAEGTELRSTTILPTAIQRSESEHILSGLTIPDEAPAHYKVRKIGLITRFRISLF